MSSGLDLPSSADTAGRCQSPGGAVETPIDRGAPAWSHQALSWRLVVWRPGLGWFLIPGQLFARILDINPSWRSAFCDRISFMPWQMCSSLSTRVLLSWPPFPLPSSSQTHPTPTPIRAPPLLLAGIPWDPAQSFCEGGASRGWGSGDLSLHSSPAPHLSGDIGQGLALL